MLLQHQQQQQQQQRQHIAGLTNYLGTHIFGGEKEKKDISNAVFYARTNTHTHFIISLALHSLSLSPTHTYTLTITLSYTHIQKTLSFSSKCYVKDWVKVKEEKMRNEKNTGPLLVVQVELITY